MTTWSYGLAKAHNAIIQHITYLATSTDHTNFQQHARNMPKNVGGGNLIILFSLAIYLA